MFSFIVESELHPYNGGNATRYYRIDCPFCPERVGKSDSSGHMHLFRDSWIGHCFRCGARKTIQAIFYALGIEFQTVPDTDELLNFISNSTQHSNIPQTPSEIEMLDKSIPIGNLNPSEPLFRRVFSTLKNWGISIDTARSMEWNWSIENDSFIFPCYMDGKLVYYQTRSLSRFRSGSSQNISKCGILYNYDCHLSESVNDVYIVEGPKDAAMFYQNGLWAVALLGHSVNQYHVYRLNKLPHNKILCLDSDVTKDSVSISQEYGWDVKYLPYGDPADFKDQLKNTLTKCDSFADRVYQLILNNQTI